MSSTNVIDVGGIQIQSLADILNDIINGVPGIPGLKEIYGPDINVDSNTPDGQMINIFALSKLDILDFCVAIYDSFDPDQAVGVALDAISQLCGITRQGGTYTQTNITVTVDRNLNLDGQDTDTPYTVADSNGNQFQLMISAALTTGANVLLFQAVNIGAVLVLPNTITVPVSIIAGVTGTNNPDDPTQVGVNQETDADFRLRREKSVSAPSQGYLQSLYGGLNNIDGVTSAAVYENVTGSADGDGIPGHSIWVVVEGGLNTDIADAIYNYRNAGCGMKGGTTVTITQIDGSTIDIKFDYALTESLYIRFKVDVIGGGSYDAAAIKNGLVSDLDFGINTPADISTVAATVKAINPLVVISDCEVSNDNITWVNIVFPSTKQKIFTLTTGHITIIP